MIPIIDSLDPQYPPKHKKQLHQGFEKRGEVFSTRGVMIPYKLICLQEPPPIRWKQRCRVDKAVSRNYQIKTVILGAELFASVLFSWKMPIDWLFSEFWLTVHVSREIWSRTRWISSIMRGDIGYADDTLTVFLSPGIGFIDGISGIPLVFAPPLGFCPPYLSAPDLDRTKSWVIVL